MCSNGPLHQVNKWKGIKKNNVRIRQRRQIRKRAELLVRMKREMRQVHKLSKTESRIPGIHWWQTDYCWNIEVKKEELVDPIPANIKVEELPTPDLQYPLTPSSHYHSLDPNKFENWGDLATA